MCQQQPASPAVTVKTKTAEIRNEDKKSFKKRVQIMISQDVDSLLIHDITLLALSRFTLYFVTETAAQFVVKRLNMLAL